MKKKDTSRELAVAAADLAADGKALDISVLELREISSVADYFVLASGRSHIQVESICDRVVEGVRDRLELRPISVEGLENSQWAVLDYGSVVIHVFQEGVRKLYDLERLWSLAPRWKHGEEPPAPTAAKAAAAKAESKTTVAGKSAKAGKAAAAKTATKAPAAGKSAKSAKTGKVAIAGKATAAKASAGKTTTGKATAVKAKSAASARAKAKASDSDEPATTRKKASGTR